MKIKKQIRLEKKKARVERIRSKNEARVTLANQGIQMKSGVGSAIESIGKAGAALLGGAAAPDASNDAIINAAPEPQSSRVVMETPEPPKASGNMKTILLAGAAIVAIMMFKK